MDREFKEALHKLVGNRWVEDEIAQEVRRYLTRKRARSAARRKIEAEIRKEQANGQNQS